MVEDPEESPVRQSARGWLLVQVTAYAFRSEHPMAFAGVTVSASFDAWWSVEPFSSTPSCLRRSTHRRYPMWWGRGSLMCPPATSSTRDQCVPGTMPRSQRSAVLCAAERTISIRRRDPGRELPLPSRISLREFPSVRWDLRCVAGASLGSHRADRERTRATQRYPRCSP
jgi:hypothetical protein